jgi:hypothetical protein
LSYDAPQTKGGMDQEARLRLDYDQTVALLQGLNETRFKLLALVPTIAGAAVGFLSPNRPAVELLALGAIGLTATLGILVYELRAGEMKNALSLRAGVLESQLLVYGPLVAPAARRLFGIFQVTHRRGVALVFGAALAAWTYVVAWGGLRAISVDRARDVGLVIGLIAGAAIFGEVERLEGQRGQAPAQGQAGGQPSGS